MSGPDFSAANAFGAPPSKAVDAGWRSPAIVGQMQRPVYLRPDADLPFFCQPMHLFLLCWLIMLCALFFHISYDSYPGFGLPLILFVMSVVALWGGFAWMRFIDPAPETRNEGNWLTLNVSRLRRLNEAFVLLASVIMYINLKLDGLPPAFGVFSFDTKIYLEYGRFKQVLFPLLITIVVNSFLDPSRFRKFLFAVFGLFSMLLYITRGEILAALLQTIFVFSLTTRLNKTKLLITAAVGVAGLALLADIIGNNRTTEAVFLQFLRIRGQYWDWPMISLWAISYFSIPLSNLCWIVRDFHFHTITLSFLYPTLPAFWTPEDPHASVLSHSHIIDGVHTYLANYFMDFSYGGILLANGALGIASSIFMRRGMSRNFLTSAIFLSCVADIFFVDNFTPLSTLVQFGVQWFVQLYILSSPIAVSGPGSVPHVA